MIPQRIVLVDDEPDIRTVAEIALSAVGGWEVRLAASGEEALAHLAAAEADLILIDVMMPGMDGFTVLSRLRSDPRWVKLPAIFMTAKVQPREVAQYLALGACGVIPKPFDPMELPQQIRALVAAL
ncbi:MAG: response regulator [Proteobacteria bacterium]|nr:response regulator [Pseudomonadota bacterium]